MTLKNTTASLLGLPYKTILKLLPDALQDKIRMARARRGAKRYMTRLIKQQLGYTINLENPKTYCEKIQWLKFNHIEHDEKIIARADKYKAREYITSKGFGEHLVKLYGVWDNAEDIDWDDLPETFVLKTNNGSGKAYRWFCEDKSSFPKQEFIRDANDKLTTRYGQYAGEFHYGKMPPKIIAEEYLVDGTEDIKDYKFYCFHGKVAFLSAETGGLRGERVADYYDVNWNRSHVRFFDDPPPVIPFDKPQTLNDMVDMAETLSKGYPHIRVDLYSISNRIYFGELTYTPENGVTFWDPPSLDLEYGNLMDINDINH